jgi:dTDP-4-amino-4,6-dideoxygalactose transaminase
LPTYGGNDFAWLRSRTRECVLELEPAIFVARGAIAIYLALKQERIDSASEVLVPAFHCPSMVAPIAGVGAKPVFYGITEELAVDMSSLRRGLSRATRAVIVPHLFGHIQPFAELKALCAESNIVVIEDCAHAIAGAEDAAVGRLGDYVVASPRKFIPLAEGGWLCGERLHAGLPLARSAGVAKNLRVLYDTLDRSHTALGAAMRSVVRSVRRRSSQSASVVVANDASEPRADTALEREIVAATAASALTRWLLPRWNFAAAAAARRQNYRDIAAAARGTLAELSSTLPRSRAPYMVPILMSDPHKQFAALKSSRVPIWRWEHSQRGVCRVTDHYAQALIQVPCHQSLSASEVACIRDTLDSMH